MQNEVSSIFIVGPMGAGKTTIGRLLAKHMDREFIDSDHFIEAQSGADIAWIFAKEGEDGFRERESRAIDVLTQRQNIVLATGGGVVMRECNRDWLTQRGIVIYLQASVETQMRRTLKDKSRPLLQQPNPKQVLSDLFKIRDPLYQQIADIIIVTGHTYPRQMLHQIVAELQRAYPQLYLSS
ncbi:shikimate kinase AroK [Psychrobacter sp. I-STPA10]|uniref:shikimate kinase AroK n=1 Tax=Psychrobacter sp. I-STPA10 TaxID=2585769 RepID=UPI001E376E7B|nr:shikimate kinase AroK [Psychrobacter sp. I-STPA10]